MIPNDLNNLNFVYFLLACFSSLVLAIAALRLLLGSVYATGNKNDELLLSLMRQQGISNWRALRNESGLTNAGLWLLRDGEVDELKWKELDRVAKVLCLPLPTFLRELDLIDENPELEACRQQCSELENQLKQLEADNNSLPIENFTNMVEVD